MLMGGLLLEEEGRRAVAELLEDPNEEECVWEYKGRPRQGKLSEFPICLSGERSGRLSPSAPYRVSANLYASM